MGEPATSVPREKQYPRLRRRLYTLAQDNRILYLEPQHPDWITINVRYKGIFDLLDGRHPRTAIDAYICQHHSDEAKVLTTQVSELIAHSVLFTDDHPPPRLEGDTTHPTLRYVYLTITDSCNLNCTYCYAKERMPVPSLPFEQWIRLVDHLISFATPLVFTFTGGEPLLFDGTLELARYVRRKGSQCILLTNGTLIRDGDFAKQLADAFNLIKISLDSHLTDVNARLRGTGCLPRVQRALELLGQAGATAMVLATVTRLNKDHLREFSSNFGNNVQFQPLYRMGSANDSPALALSGDEYFDALSAAGVIQSLSEYHGSIHAFRGNPRKRCAMAAQELSIGPNGDVFPCHMLHYQDLKLGNLAEVRGMEAVYASPLACRLRRLSVDVLPQCRECPVRNFCAGACRARISYPSPGLEGSDPFCNFERRLILDALLYSYG
jgi:radical SAM protein with 4Fe4S-binding SPASM domain